MDGVRVMKALGGTAWGDAACGAMFSARTGHGSEQDDGDPSPIS